MARGYRQNIIESGSKPTPSLLKLFWDGTINGIEWNFNWKKSSSDSSESHSITETLNINASGYNAECQFYTGQIDLTEYSTINFTVTEGTSQTESGRKVGVMVNNAINSTYQKQVQGVGGVNTYVIDISTLTGFYYVGVYLSSQNRWAYNPHIKVSKVWLEK